MMEPIVAETQVFIVEDEPLLLRQIQRMLQLQGIGIKGAFQTGESLLEALREESPHIILMDISLKGTLDGIETAEQVHLLKDIPIVFMTASQDPALFERAKVSDPFGFILKPFKPRELVLTLQIALHKHKFEKKLREQESRLSTTLQSISDGVITTNEYLEIEVMNVAAEHLFGKVHTDGVPLSLHQIFDSQPPACSAKVVSLAIDALTKAASVTSEVPLKLSAPEKHLEVTVTPVIEPGHSPKGVVLVFHDLTRQKQDERRLFEANQKLEQKVEERTRELERTIVELKQFAYVASHDLREPIRVIVSFIQLLQKSLEGKLDDEQKSFMQFAYDGAIRMQGLLSAILRYSRVQTRQREYRISSVASIIQDACKNLYRKIEDAGAKIEVEEMPEIEVDETQITQVFQNLIGNGIKFCQTRTPEVTIVAKDQGDQVLFQVSDNGIGIEKKYEEKIFQMFQRLNAQSEFEGNGLGLAICKGIIERHGGDIWLESTPGAGTTFFFTLPKTQLS
ncbi:MAG: ATP-binding protein [Bacteroidota bacterium]